MTWNSLVTTLKPYCDQQLKVYLGNMIGTSCDEIADFTAAVFDPITGKPICYRDASVTIPRPLQQALLFVSKAHNHPDTYLVSPTASSRPYQQLENQLTEFLLTAFTQVIAEMELLQLPKSQLVLSPHGVTMNHEPWADPPFSVQIVNGEQLLQLGYDVVTSHRQQALAISSAAPLAPVLIRECFYQPQHNTVVINGGGIANLCTLPAGEPNHLVAWDIGPANATLDALIQFVMENYPNLIPNDLRTEILRHGYDVSGQWAARGQVDQAILQALLQHEYFSRPSQFKSADRATFGCDWVFSHSSVHTIAWADLLATVTECIAITIVTAIQQSLTTGTTPVKILFYGGIIHNNYLMQRIKLGLAQTQLNFQFETLDQLGFNPDNFEALLMAYLGYCADQQQTVDLRYCKRENIQPELAKAIPGYIHRAQHKTDQKSMPLSKIIFR